MNKEIKRLKQLSGITEEYTSRTNRFDFNRSKQIAQFLVDMSQELTKEQKKFLTEKIRKDLC